jgi:DNA-binding transcriptional regulator YiaG
MDLGLRQEDAARALGVKTGTVVKWELGISPVSHAFLPVVIQFLGYDPVPEVAALPDQIWAARRLLGLSQKQLARRFAMDPKTVREWEADRVHRRTRRVEAIFQEFVRTAGVAQESRDRSGVTCGPLHDGRTDV